MADHLIRTRRTSGQGQEWKWQVTGYASNRHKHFPHIKFGDILVQTVHQTDSSKDIEVLAWKSRMDRSDDVAYVTVVNKHTFESETIYPERTKSRARTSRRNK